MQILKLLSLLSLVVSACSLYIEDDSDSDEQNHYTGDSDNGRDSNGTNPSYDNLCSSLGEDCYEEACCEGTYCISEINAYVPSICVEPGEIGEYCWENHHCASDICENGACVPSGESCDQLGSVCDYQSCCEGSYCSVELLPYGEAQCVDPGGQGEFCINESHCASGLCEAGYCALPAPACQALNTPCSDTPCCEGSYCSQDINAYLPASCVAAGGIGDFCWEAAHCASAMCSQGLCLASE